MKLPASNLIKDPDMRFLYDYDLKEFFNPNERDALRFQYETKLNLVLDTIDKMIKRGETVIDIGCAQGNYALSIAARGIYTIGLDLRRSFIMYAKMKTEKYERSNLDFVVANAECLPFLSESVSYIYLGELLEHLSEPTRVLKEVKRVLKRESCAIISTPNAECFRKMRIRTYVDARRMPRHELDKLKFAPDTHVFEFTRTELLSLLSNHFHIFCFKYLWPINPLPLLYKIPLPSKLIRRIEMMLLNIYPAFGGKFASNMICMVIPKQCITP